MTDISSLCSDDDIAVKYQKLATEFAKVEYLYQNFFINIFFCIYPVIKNSLVCKENLYLINFL